MALFEGFRLYGEDCILLVQHCCCGIFLFCGFLQRGKFDALRQGKIIGFIPWPRNQATPAKSLKTKAVLPCNSTA
jgi:hypothetical protein